MVAVDAQRPAVRAGANPRGLRRRQTPRPGHGVSRLLAAPSPFRPWPPPPSYGASTTGARGYGSPDRRSARAAPPPPGRRRGLLDRLAQAGVALHMAPALIEQCALVADRRPEVAPRPPGAASRRATASGRVASRAPGASGTGSARASRKVTRSRHVPPSTQHCRHRDGAQRPAPPLAPGDQAVDEEAQGTLELLSGGGLRKLQRLLQTLPGAVKPAARPGRRRDRGRADRDSRSDRRPRIAAGPPAPPASGRPGAPVARPASPWPRASAGGRRAGRPGGPARPGRRLRRPPPAGRARAAAARAQNGVGAAPMRAGRRSARPHGDDDLLDRPGVQLDQPLRAEADEARPFGGDRGPDPLQTGERPAPTRRRRRPDREGSARGCGQRARASPRRIPLLHPERLRGCRHLPNLLRTRPRCGR